MLVALLADWGYDKFLRPSAVNCAEPECLLTTNFVDGQFGDSGGLLRIHSRESLG
jgi:hypothetical protein